MSRTTRCGSREVAKSVTLKNKERRAGKNFSRRGKASGNVRHERFLKDQASDRWPTEGQLINYHELNIAKKPRGGGRRKGGITPPEFPFALLEQAVGDNEPHKTRAVRRLLLAASLEIKPVRRYPGWILARSYNLKNRVLDLS